MSYVSLYRRRRPLSFADMTGQEHVTRTLSNALCRDRVAHAYLFCGPRGTGKTTAAKILARAMNCERYPVAEPCGQCSSCRNILAGVSIDVVEMDAASNRGIDEIRDLREKTRFAGGEGRYKVYIIDEAHMLTPEACNAFLKTLEEPPPKVVFILATTDLARLPATIVSRCQRFDFHLLTWEQIYRRLQQVLSDEGRSAGEDALGLVARLADGSLRDALGILEQAAAYAEGEIEAEHVRNVTGATRVETIETLVRAAVENDPDSGLASINEVVFSGRDLNLFMRDLLLVFSRLLLDGGATGEGSPSSVHGFENLVQSHRGILDMLSLFDAVELLHEAASEIRHTHFPQFTLEIAFIRLLRTLHGRTPAAGQPGRQEKGPAGVPPVERKEAGGGGAVDQTLARRQPSPEPVQPSTPVVLPGGQARGDQPESPGLSGQHDSDRNLSDPSPAESSDLQAISAAGAGSAPPAGDDGGHLERLLDEWPAVLQRMKQKQKSTAAWLEPARLTGCRGSLVLLAYTPEYKIHQERIMDPGHRRLVEEVLSSFCRTEIEIKAFVSDEGGVATAGTETAATPPADQGESPGKKSKPSAEKALKLFGGRIIDLK